ncbi:HD domain-containing phosphohydrolase [Thauera sp.]|uniref:HD-GYP domain-containing protein n=1 Tax=Thauera sp. TaxID=1905334 RepID=UPI00257EA89B|nr:HD domain-containing phosphohydrolase [Thauera sp.]
MTYDTSFASTFSLPEIGQQQMLRILQDFHQVRKQREEAYVELKRAHQLTLAKLALAAEYKDGDTGTHITRIGVLSAILARAMGMPFDWCELLAHAAPMHDIGKIGVPDHILKKTGPLDPAEQAIMQTHPTIGAQILGGTSIPVLDMAAEIAHTHHEKWDGSGYPRGLAGDEIPLSGRLVAAVDFFDALTMDRCYRKALPDEEAILMLKVGAGQHFDPAVVDVMLAHIDRLREARSRINAGGAQAVSSPAPWWTTF